MNIWERRNEPVYFGAEELRVALQDYATRTEAVLRGLQASALNETEEYRASAWRPHVPQMVMALARFRDRCQDEIENIGTWREDGLDPEEVHEMVWENGEQLVRWLNRMIGTEERPK